MSTPNPSPKDPLFKHLASKCPKVGMRMIKTVLAVLLCLLLEPLLIGSNGFYGAVAAIICLKSQWQDTFAAGKDRVLATFIGGFIGWLLIQGWSFFSSQYSGILYTLFIVLMMLLMMWLLLLFKLDRVISTSCVVYFSITLNHAIDRSPFSLPACASPPH